LVIGGFGFTLTREGNGNGYNVHKKSALLVAKNG